jgi:hypothetical protein
MKEICGTLPTLVEPQTRMGLLIRISMWPLPSFACPPRRFSHRNCGCQLSASPRSGRINVRDNES